jgi:hypothetical protein
VSGSASPNALATFTASWPCMESTTKSVSIGSTAAWIAFTSAIIASSIARRPAVSTMRTSWKCFLAQSSALAAISTGFCEASEGKRSIASWAARDFNCSMAAGR